VAYKDDSNGGKATVMEALPTITTPAITSTATPGSNYGTTTITATPGTGDQEIAEKRRQAKTIHDEARKKAVAGLKQPGGDEDV
jgi:hypothetical protein